VRYAMEDLECLQAAFVLWRVSSINEHLCIPHTCVLLQRNGSHGTIINRPLSELAISNIGDLKVTGQSFSNSIGHCC